MERTSRSGTTFALRFRAYGRRHYLTLGNQRDGWSRGQAELELANVLADVRRGIWRPHEPPPEPAEVPTFHEFASEWLVAREPELAPKTIKDYRWALTDHLLSYFAEYRLNEITAELVDRYKAAKAREGRLAPAQINKTLKRLAQILELAVDYDHLPRNPAASKGGRRRLKEPKPQRSWVEPEQLMALLDAAPAGHRTLLATLAGAGLRVGEACALDWASVNLATGTVRVRKSKTDAGTDREVDLPLGLADELRAYKAAAIRTAPADPVFLSRPRNGKAARQTPDNVGRRLKTAVRRANRELAEVGIEPIGERVSPHSLRRTYASIRAACGDDPVYIAAQLGHEDPTFTIRVYAKAAKRRERLSEEYREAFDLALEWARMGTIEASGADPARRAPTGRKRESRSLSRKRVTRPRSSAG